MNFLMIALVPLGIAVLLYVGAWSERLMAKQPIEDTPPPPESLRS